MRGLLAEIPFMLAAIAVIGVVLALIIAVRPMGKETAIRIASQHALLVYPRIKLDEYWISAPPRADWLTEWTVEFNHKSDGSGFVILVTGGDLYNGSKMKVDLDRSWGPRANAAP